MGLGLGLGLGLGSGSGLGFGFGLERSLPRLGAHQARIDHEVEELLYRAADATRAEEVEGVLAVGTQEVKRVRVVVLDGPA